MPFLPDVLLKALQPLLGRAADEIVIGVRVDQRIVLAVDRRGAEVEDFACEAG